MPADPKFPECVNCVFHGQGTFTAYFRCRKCDGGEFFEERVEDQALDDNKLMEMYSRMPNDSQD